MSDIAIRVDNLGKKYLIGSTQEKYRTLRDSISDALISPFRKTRALLSGQAGSASSANQEIWALRDLSFEVKQGEVVGIIGHNGAGKSTLLKILARITEPSLGYLDIYGRVGALLEAGTGFHPELTGRENIYLNGAILGMDRKEIDRKFDEIVDFSGVEKFIDTAVKHYSSGMGLRLGFAVSAHLEPDILVVDEVLAVGDAAFQRKCIGKMNDVASAGRTVLFVSHNMAAIQSLCQRAILLKDGHVIADASAAEVVHRYQNDTTISATRQVWTDIESAPGNAALRIHKAGIYPLDEHPDKSIYLDSPLAIEFEYWNLEADSHLTLAIHVYDSNDVIAFATTPIDDTLWHNKPHPRGLFRSRCFIPANLLNSGIYTIEVLFLQDINTRVHKQKNIISFEVLEKAEDRDGYFGNWAGVLRPQLDWETELLHEMSPTTLGEGAKNA